MQGNLTLAMRSLFLILVILLLHVSVFAQTSVAGTVIDKITKRPIEFASVLLVRLPDSTNTGTVTDKKGKFTIAKIDTGTYLLKCSFIGFGDIQTTPFTIGINTPNYTLSTIELVNDSKSLTDVTVTGRKNILNTSIDRKVYNVEQDIMSRSGSASDILKNVPSVEVDIDGNVSLRGAGDVMILINGKPSPLMGRSRAEVLQQLPANSIERIEVITNPSARYRPDGTSGIINIVLKKNVKNGFNGTVTANAGNRDRYNSNISLNYKPGKFNLFGSYSIRRDYRRRFNTLDRTNLDSISGAVKDYYTQQGNWMGRPFANVVTAGIDYNINEKNSIGVSGTYFYRTLSRNSIMQNFYFDSHNTLTDRIDRLQKAHEPEKQPNGVFYFQHQFPKEDHEIRVEFNLSNEKEVEDNRFTNLFIVPAKPSTLDNTRISQGNKENQFTIDYSNPLSESGKLEAGYDGQYNRSDLDFYGEYYDDTLRAFLMDVEKTNRFLYRENMHALYTTFQKEYEKFGFSLGIRGEGVFTRGHLQSTNVDSFVNNNYFKVYPTMHLSWKLKENHELQLNYSKRVNRPEGDELNPFPEYQDPRNISAGNPKLLPEIIHSVEFGYKWEGSKLSFVPGIYYRYTKNRFTTVTLPLNDSTFLTTEQNLSKDQAAGLELILSARNGKWFSTNLSANIFYNKINADNLGYAQDRSVVSMFATLSTNFTITKTTMLQLSANYRSARLTAQGKYHPSFVFNSGLRQDIFRSKVSITLTASDLFNSLRQKSELNTKYFKQFSQGRRDGRIVYLGISYRFGVMLKTKEEKMQFDDTMN
jgi:outer membrane receptor protein involved in Fe transport